MPESKPGRPSSRHPARVISSFSQLGVALQLCDKGPLTAKELCAPGALLALMERRGIIEAVPSGRIRVAATWKLTPVGRRAARRCRKAHARWPKMRPVLPGKPRR